MAKAKPAAAEGEQSHRLIIIASSAGTAFEWYDFFIYGSLASILASHFFVGVNETTGYIFSLLAFAAGFFVRPFGALIFGHIGDRAGRKYTFLITMTVMGVATFAVGLLPNSESIGIAAPIGLITLRLIQGLALGGEYGGAAIYVAEHAPAHRRGFYTSWIQTAAAVGLLLSVSVVFGTRSLMGEAEFRDWGWRIPFLLSSVLLAISIWIRLKLHESPVFQRMKEAGKRSKAPLVDSFLRKRNLKVVLLALVGVAAAQGVVWYTANFYAPFFLERVLKVDAPSTNVMVLIAVALSAPFYVFAGWLSDRIGRKKVMYTGAILATLTFIPLFQMLTAAANPDLAAAQDKAPVTVVADPEACALQFDPLGRSKFTSSCDVAKTFLAGSGVSYANEAAPGGSLARVRIGAATVESFEGGGLDAASYKAAHEAFVARLKAALADAGYPLVADPSEVDSVLVVALLVLMIFYAALLYGPQAAALVELFPTNIRYTSLSFPYHLGIGWLGGFLPAAAFAMVAANGDMYFGLWYPVIVTAISVVIGIFLIPETKDVDIQD